MAPTYDAVIVGAGPNGLSAAITLARDGHRVLVLEANERIGGGCQSGELTLPGYVHDICAAVHAMGVVSPFFKGVPLAQLGVEWVGSAAAVAHPFDDGTAAVLHHDTKETGDTLGPDAQAWAQLMQPYVRRSDTFFSELLRPVRIPSHPVLMARFGLIAIRSCASVVKHRFRGERARALFSGCAAHSFLALDAPASASFGLALAVAAHTTPWAVVRGGSQQLVNGLARYLESLGGAIETGRRVVSIADVPAARTVLFDLAPRVVEPIAGEALPCRYRAQLRRFRPGPAVFKVDWALAGPIPWRAKDCGRALTVHVGGRFEEIAESEAATSGGRVSDRPFVIVAQQSSIDFTRAPAGAHTGWAYCHVPNGCTTDMTERIERQIERFAPGFREVIRARHAMSPVDFEAHNANMIGGDIAGGANDLEQFVLRPTIRWNSYATPNPQLFLCSSSTPPGAGVHGMCGYWAARAAQKQLG